MAISDGVRFWNCGNTHVLLIVEDEGAMFVYITPSRQIADQQTKVYDPECGRHAVEWLIGQLARFKTTKENTIRAEEFVAKHTAEITNLVPFGPSKNTQYKRLCNELNDSRRAYEELRARSAADEASLRRQLQNCRQALHESRALVRRLQLQESPPQYTDPPEYRE